MSTVEGFLASGQAAGLVLLIVFLEGGLLLMRHLRARPERASVVSWLSPLLAGAALVVALLLVQSGASPRYLGLALTVAGVAHLMGYRQRWYS